MEYTIIRNRDYSADTGAAGLWEEYEYIIFSYCNFTGSILAGTFYNCIFEDTCTYLDTAWIGTFVHCTGVGQ